MFIIRLIFNCCFWVLLKLTIDEIMAEFEVTLQIGSCADGFLPLSLGQLNNFNPIGDLGAIKFISYGKFRQQKRECKQSSKQSMERAQVGRSRTERNRKGDRDHYCLVEIGRAHV